MTLDQFVSNPPTGYNGKVVRGGQCGELVRQYWIDVDQTSPPSYTNSKDYWSNPVPGYDKVSSPQPGDIAIYNGHGAYTEGHSAIYYDGRVFEQNADPDGSPAHLFTRANTYLLGYLRKQGETTMPDVMDTNDGIEAYRVAFHRDPGAGDAPDQWNGQKFSDIANTSIRASQEWKDIDWKLKDYPVTAKRADDLAAQVAALQKQIGAKPIKLIPGQLYEA